MRTFASVALLGLATGALATVPGARPELSEVWLDDFDRAVEVAKEQKKDLFVDFTGSDWCGWCIRLDSEVFEHEEFLSAVQENYVLLKLDYPRGEEAKAKVPNPERNAELSEHYQIGGFPTILLMTADGEAYAKTGYQPGGPTAYVEHVNEIRAEGREKLEAAIAFVKSFDEAEGEAKLALLEEAFERLEKSPEDSPFTGKYAEVVKAAFQLDPKNEAGLTRRAVEALMERGMVDDEVRAAASAMDPKNELGFIERLVKAQCESVRDEDTMKAALAEVDKVIELGFQDKEIGFELLLNATFWSKRILEDDEKTAHYGALAREIGTEDERLQQILDSLIEADDEDEDEHDGEGDGEHGGE